jgi:hypothetical protein
MTATVGSATVASKVIDDDVRRSRISANCTKFKLVAARFAPHV